MPEFPNLVFSDEFFLSFADRTFGAADRRAILKALELLNRDASHPSLRVHALRGELAGSWSASVTASIRIEFVRDPEARLRLRRCSRHYDR
ncbi:MAG: hypothetical protein ACKVT1_10280 [Dehalococcoidia bacterium]